MNVPDWLYWLVGVGLMGGLLYAVRLAGELLVDVALVIRWLWRRLRRREAVRS